MLQRRSFWRDRIQFDAEPPPPAPPPPAAPPPAAPPPNDSVPAWRAGIAPEFAEVHQVKTAKDVNDVIKWGINAEKMVGADKLVLPGKDAKPEERQAALDAIYEKLGRPKEAAGYVFTPPKDVQFSDADKALQGKFGAVAHKLGLSQEQADGLAAWQMESTIAGIQAATQASADAEAALRKEFGDKYDAKVEGANKALSMALSAAGIKVEEFRTLKLADGTYAGDSPRMVKLWAAIGDMIGETGFNGGEGGGGGNSLGAFATPAAAKAELDKLYSKFATEKTHPYNNKRDPLHSMWTDRVMKLEAKAAEQPK